MQSHYCLTKLKQSVVTILPFLVSLVIFVNFTFSPTVNAEIPISMDGMMYKLATEQNDAAAQYFIGRNYLVGKSVPVNKSEAAKWFTKAAEQNYAKAEYELGMLYLRGEGVTQNYQAAFKLMTSAAKRNLADAQFVLGKMHLKEISGLSKPDEAVKWLEKAAIRNHTPAMYTLGKLFYEGKVVSVNKKQGKELIKDAAELGDPDAINYLKSIKS